MKRALLVVVGIAALAALFYAATLSQAGVECEACMRFGGRETCRRAAASTQEEAERAAVANACALLGSGVTATVACQGTPPLSLACESR